MRRFYVLSTLAASTLAMCAAFASGTTSAQTAPGGTQSTPTQASAAQAPSTADATATALKKAAAGAATKPSAVASPAPAAAPTAANPGPATQSAPKAKVVAKADPAKPAKPAAGEVMSGPMAATHAFFGADTYAAPAPSKTAVRPGCTRLAHSAIDVGKENPIKFSREGIDNQIAALTKTKGWKTAAKSDEKIICTEFVNLGLFGQEYTCRVETTVCPK